MPLQHANGADASAFLFFLFFCLTSFGHGVRVGKKRNYHAQGPGPGIQVPSYAQRRTFATKSRRILFYPSAPPCRCFSLTTSLLHGIVITARIVGGCPRRTAPVIIKVSFNSSVAVLSCALFRSCMIYWSSFLSLTRLAVAVFSLTCDAMPIWMV